MAARFTFDTFVRSLIASLCVLTLVLTAGCGSKPDTHYYKLSIHVKTPTGERSGSGVFKVVVGGDIKVFGWMGTGGHFVAGEAIPVDLPNRQTLWVLMANDWQDGSDWAADALTRLPASDPAEEGLPYVVRPGWTPQPFQRTVEVLSNDRDNYPYFIRFRDPANPLSMEIVDPDDLAASFGPGVSLDRLTVQYTEEKVSRRLHERLTPAFFDRWERLLDRFSACRDVDHPFMRLPAFTIRSTAFSQPIDTIPGESRTLAAAQSAGDAYKAIPCNRLIPGFEGNTVRRLGDRPVFKNVVDSVAGDDPITFAEWTPGKTRLDSNYLGTLGVVDNCLTLNGSSNPMLLILPRGEARWNERGSVLTFRGKDYRLGDRISLLGKTQYLYVDGGKPAYPQDARRLGDFSFKRCNGFDIWLTK